jgi:hypothetical protein
MHETSTVCSGDCGDLALATNDIKDRGAQGTMFDVVALRDVSITSFDLYCNRAVTEQLQIYTRQGSYKGHELSQDGWTLVYDKMVSLGGRDNLVELDALDSEVEIAEGTRQAFYIFTNGVVLYTGGTREGNLYAADDALGFYEGVGIDAGTFSGNTGNLWAPRVFSGNIR